MINLVTLDNLIGSVSSARWKSAYELISWINTECLPNYQRRGQRRLKNMNFSFTYESCGTLKSLTFSIIFKKVSREFVKISRRGSSPPNNPEFDQLTLLFCRGRQNLYQCITLYYEL